MARRRHAAAATRRLVGGFAAAITLGIVGALGIAGSSTGTATASQPSAVETPTTPPTIVRTVYRYVEVPVGSATPSPNRRTAPSATGATPAPSAPAPQPVIRTKGS